MVKYEENLRRLKRLLKNCLMNVRWKRYKNVFATFLKQFMLHEAAQGTTRRKERRKKGRKEGRKEGRKGVLCRP